MKITSLTVFLIYLLCACPLWAQPIMAENSDETYEVQFEQTVESIDINDYGSDELTVYDSLSKEDQKTFLKKRALFLGKLASGLIKSEVGITKNIIKGANLKSGKLKALFTNSETDELINGRDIVMSLLKILDRQLISAPRAFVKTIETGYLLTFGVNWATGGLGKVGAKFIPGIKSQNFKFGHGLYFGLIFARNEQSGKTYIEFITDFEKVERVYLPTFELSTGFRALKLQSAKPINEIGSLSATTIAAGPLPAALSLSTSPDYYATGVHAIMSFPPIITSLGAYKNNVTRKSLRLELSAQPIKDLASKVIPWKRLRSQKAAVMSCVFVLK